jgi:LAO/AO transport system kinase
VLVVPGLGDDVQNMKAGLMEAADIFVLNKADREGADGLEQQLASMLELAPGKWQPPIVRTTATTGDGIAELTAAIERFRAQIAATGESRAKVLAHWKARLLALIEQQFLDRAVGGPVGQRELESLAAEVADRRKSPYAAARELAARAET